ncbi:MAG: DUF2294 domain-containing protein [candidate division KSB1 bacterium]|nr:DUF2294 domain-containing protein [candidate division KSB1 bacterium]MDZ7273469.1 DUF2294 domain-containing protein [candidate division KSB1 bacterium]MDZ7286939.1 DUF2294 domain-containing protein [candidate division KSB1 bacterium]MDZ7299708.1 DUF2294 domain-containing protein [candidate division KSB1 bacterium]MDZ7305647.1 DUF2294 domain-containing protein [candidate division KSB1 bacterium]
MNNATAALARQISALVADFLNQQLGEHAAAVETFLSGNLVTVRASDCFAPGERALARNETDWRLFHQFKSQQFESVKWLLKERLEEITGCEVRDLVSALGPDGMRFAVVTLNKSIEIEREKCHE